MPIVTRTAGTCPICMGIYKVRGGKLVHHGYQRPGHGYIVGDCFGVHWPPYESSHAVCDAYKKMLVKWTEASRERIAYLEARKPDHLTSQNWRKQDVSYPRGTAEYEQIRSSSIRREEQQIGMMRHDDARMNELIKAWKEKPLLEIDEEGCTPEMRKEQEARREVKRAEKAARDAEKAARRARTQAREDAKYAKKVELKRQLSVLAQRPKSADRDLQAKRVNADIIRSRLTFWDLSDDRDEYLALVAIGHELGLGTKGEGGAFSWAKWQTARGKVEL